MRSRHPLRRRARDQSGFAAGVGEMRVSVDRCSAAACARAGEFGARRSVPAQAPYLGGAKELGADASGGMTSNGSRGRFLHRDVLFKRIIVLTERLRRRTFDVLLPDRHWVPARDKEVGMTPPGQSRRNDRRGKVRTAA